MKVFLTSLDVEKSQHSVFYTTFGAFFELVDDPENADFVFLVPVPHCEFSMNWDAAIRITHSKKPIVVFDYFEHGWWKGDTVNWMLGDKELPKDTEFIRPYDVLSKWVFGNKAQIKAYFQRELHKEHTKENFPVYPIDWYNSYVWEAIDTRVEFDARPIDVLWIYGNSHPMRQQFHGEMMKQAFPQWDVITDEKQIPFISNPTVAMLYKPHFDRLSQEEVYRIQSLSKITVSLPGFGVKCFRDTEAIVNSIVALPENNMVYHSGIKNIGLVLRSNPKSWVSCLSDFFKKDLYEKYLGCIKRSLELKPDRVWNDYIFPIISK